MLTTQCRFMITHDGKRHEVIYYTHTGRTHIFVDNKITYGASFICEDRKSAELFVQLYTLLKDNKPSE